jgi:hypothetical protein
LPPFLFPFPSLAWPITWWYLLSVAWTSQPSSFWLWKPGLLAQPIWFVLD